MKTQDRTYIPFNSHAETIYRSVEAVPQGHNPDVLSALYIARKFEDNDNHHANH